MTACKETLPYGCAQSSPSCTAGQELRGRVLAASFVSPYTIVSFDSTVAAAVQVQALLDCLADAAFNLQVCICSVGATRRLGRRKLGPIMISDSLMAAYKAAVSPFQLLASSLPLRHPLNRACCVYSSLHANRWCRQHTAGQLPHTGWPHLQLAHRPGCSQTCQQVCHTEDLALWSGEAGICTGHIQTTGYLPVFLPSCPAAAAVAVGGAAVLLSSWAVAPRWCTCLVTP